jgi:purine-binding chemotaxis protein CheW
VRGRILTVIDLARRLGLDAGNASLAIGISHFGESYGLLVEKVGDVLKLPLAGREANPVNLDRRLAQVSAGVHRLADSLVLVLDLDRLLEFGASARAA